MTYEDAVITTFSGVNAQLGYAVVRVNASVCVVTVFPSSVVKVPVMVTVNVAVSSTSALYQKTSRSNGFGNVMKLVETLPGLLTAVIAIE